MGDERTAWHYGFGELVEEEVGTAMEVMRELKLVNEQRTDIILLRKEAHSSEPIVGSLGRLWAVLPKMSVIEYKSRGDPPNVGVLDQLFGYGHLAARRFRDNLDEAEDLALVLAVGTVTPSLEREIGRFAALRIEEHGGGLCRLHGTLYPSWILLLNEVADDVGRPLLGIFGSRPLHSMDKEAHRWLGKRFMSKPELEDLPDYDEIAEALENTRAGDVIFRARLKKTSPNEIVDALLEDGHSVGAIVSALLKDGRSLDEIDPELRAQLLRLLQANEAD